MLSQKQAIIVLALLSALSIFVLINQTHANINVNAHVNINTHTNINQYDNNLQVQNQDNNHNQQTIKQIQTDYNVKQSNGLIATLKSISSVLRAKLSGITLFNETTVFAGDVTGAVGIWQFDAKKKKLDFFDFSREISPVLPNQNKVVHLQGDNTGVLVLTQDGKITSYAVNAQSKIIGNSSITLDQAASWFTVAKAQPVNSSSLNADIPPILAQINTKKSQLCLYSLHESLGRPNPITKITCNSTSSSNVTYQHVSYDPLNNYIVVGDESRAIIFKLSINAEKKVQLKYLTEAFLAKVDVKGFKSVFANGTLLAVNDLWLSSIVIDASVPSAKVISAERTQKIIKSGLTTDISAVFDAKLKKSMTFINSKDRVQAYTVANNKLTYVNDSKVIGSCQNFVLRDEATLFAAVGEQIQTLKIGDTQEKDYLTVEDEATIGSNNHFKPVRTMALYNNTFITASEGSKFNLKLWNYSPNDYKLTYADEKSVSFFSILKSGYISFLNSIMIPPTTTKINLHVALAVADPFSLYIVPITSANKFGTVFRSKDEHSSNVTAIFLSEDKKQIITGSMDSTIKVWTLTTNHDQVQDNTTTIASKNGPIRCGAQDKTGQYFAFGHNNNIFNKLVNISIWKSDPKHGLVKLAQNDPGESHEANLTGLVITHDQKYLISLSESGQIRLWRHQGWTMVDLMGSLGLGVFDATIQATQTNTLLAQSQKFFAEYFYDQNGFILLGRTSKTYPTLSNSSLLVGKTWFQGSRDGGIRVYSIEN